MTDIVVTGANSGIGFEAALRLAGGGARVVLAVRDEQRGAAARAAILAAHPSAEVSVARVDLTDLDSVRALAKALPRVDVLVNNAGIGTAPLVRSREGVVSQFAANHLGHFLLTALLWPKLTSAVDGRVVTVGSGFGRRGTLDLSNLDASRGYSQGGAYVQSKLANTLFAAELSRRAEAAGASVKSVLVHPGVAATEMQRKPTGLLGVLARTVRALLARSAENGARPTVLAATGADVKSGEVYGPGRWASDPARREERWPAMEDRDGARALWERSEALTGTRFL